MANKKTIQIEALTPTSDPAAGRHKAMARYEPTYALGTGLGIDTSELFAPREQVSRCCVLVRNRDSSVRRCLKPRADCRGDWEKAAQCCRCHRSLEKQAQEWMERSKP
jgi:hypothetical protein